MKGMTTVVTALVFTAITCGAQADVTHKTKTTQCSKGAYTCFNSSYQVAQVKQYDISFTPKMAANEYASSNGYVYRTRNFWGNYYYSFSKYGPSSAAGTFVFNPRVLKWAAYDRSGRLVSSGRASGGMGYCPDVRRSCRTPVGHFRVYHKGPAYCVSSKYPVGRGGGYMPYCMFFHGGYAIHGSYEVPNHNASHGCIRVVPDAARWLHRSFIVPGTRVIVMPY